jgi:hypothetical protein
MDEVVGCCGITCSECEIYKATKTNDYRARALILNRDKERFDETFRSLYGREYGLEDINCDGCSSNGRVFWYIDNCEIRACCLNRNHENCAQCREYPCVVLKKLFEKSHVDAKRKLDEIRNKLE